MFFATKLSYCYTDCAFCLKTWRLKILNMQKSRALIFFHLFRVWLGGPGAGLHRSALGSHSWPLHIYSDWPWVMAPADAHCAVINPESLLGLKCMWSLFCGSGLIFLSHLDHRNGEMCRCAPGSSSWLLQCETLASHQMLQLVSMTCKNIYVLLSFMLTWH